METIKFANQCGVEMLVFSEKISSALAKKSDYSKEIKGIAVYYCVGKFRYEEFYNTLCSLGIANAKLYWGKILRLSKSSTQNFIFVGNEEEIIDKISSIKEPHVPDSVLVKMLSSRLCKLHDSVVKLKAIPGIGLSDFNIVRSDINNGFSKYPRQCKVHTVSILNVLKRPGMNEKIIEKAWELYTVYSTQIS